MDTPIFIYFLTMLLLWQIVGNFSLAIQNPDRVSYAERNLWGSNNIFTLIGLILAKIFWLFALGYPIYWFIKHNFLQALIILLVGTLGMIFVGSIIKKLFRVPEIILVYTGIVLCPFLIIAIWFF